MTYNVFSGTLNPTHFIYLRSQVRRGRPDRRFQSLGKGATLVQGVHVVYRWIGTCNVTEELKAGGTDDVCEWWLISTSAVDLLIRNAGLQEMRDIRRRHHWSNASIFLAS